MRLIRLTDAESFVKHGLKGKLQRDLRRMRILKEGDVEFRDDPANIVYHGDIPVWCGRCGNYHLSRPEWLEFKPWETPAAELKVN